MDTEKQAQRDKVQNSLRNLNDKDFYQNLVEFWDTLGYKSNRQPEVYEYTYENFKHSFNDGYQIKDAKAQGDSWESLFLLFQVTDEELKTHFAEQVQTDLFGYKPPYEPHLQSYLFVGLVLKGEGYSRTALADIARQINRCFAIPLIITFKYGDHITIAVVNRRLHKRDKTKDVLEKVTLIKDINLLSPHRAHTDILCELSIEVLSDKGTLNNFDDLHKAWARTLDISELNKRFYKELSNWYFWAIQNVEFPAGEEPDREKRNSISVIRLLTRMIFVWFMKEKGLIPEALFDTDKLKTIIKFDDFNGTSYYKAILQNLFFATLNTEMNHDVPGSRRFRKDNNGDPNPDFNNHNVYRYKHLFHNPETVIDSVFGEIPFLNGGLFECLDSESTIEGKKQYIRVDGFSDRHDNVLKFPDELFFKGKEEKIDLNDIYGTKNKKYTIKGLIPILHSYKFTVAENTPVEEEVALDPELLGRVFENLLASYNPETKNTARHDTGSFYTPREIVEFMVNEALIAYLQKSIASDTAEQKADNELRLRLLLTYTDEEHLFTEAETDMLIHAIDNLKSMDPACGSGAFLMGLLLKMVYILHKLDPHNERWKTRQIGNIQAQIEDSRKITDIKVQSDVIAKLEDSIKDIQTTFEDFDFDYSRKLFLIERCMYGSDIQPIAIQIAKLRFFISLLVDQYKKPDSYNHGIRSLPNLETNLVAANSLIPLQLNVQLEIFFEKEIEDFKTNIANIHNEYFSARSRQHKQKIKDKEKKERKKFSKALRDLKVPIQKADLIAKWDPYSSNSFAEFFDLGIMFGISSLNMVITNPPFIRQEDIGYKPALKEAGYTVYNSTSDLYTYFYELSYKLLANDGVASFITSNKWLRSKYGTKLRNLLKSCTQIHSIIDFGGYQVFESATVDTSILIYEKSMPSVDNHARFLTIDKSFRGKNLEELFYNSHIKILQNSLKDGGWTLAPTEVLALKDKIERIGVPLKNWDVNVFYGVKTGFNDAFIIDTETKNRLCLEDPRSIEVLKPVLRGRDIGRYEYHWAGQWLIVIPSGWTNSHREMLTPEKFIIQSYPAIYKHLIQTASIKSRGKGLYDRDDQGDYWWELRDCAYYSEFDKDKIVWADIADGSCFHIDSKQHIIANTAYMLTGSRIRSLLGILNSKVYDFYFNLISSGLSSNANRGFKIFIEQFPIPDNPDILNKIEHEVNQLLTLIENRNQDEDISHPTPIADIENAINKLVYSLYDLSPAEISLMEKLCKQ